MERAQEEREEKETQSKACGSMELVTLRSWIEQILSYCTPLRRQKQK
jgi:hypothetical protein